MVSAADVALGDGAAVLKPSFWGDLVQSPVVTAGGNVEITLVNGGLLSVRPHQRAHRGPERFDAKA